MKTRTIKLYPAPTELGSQRINDETVPLQWAIAQLDALRASRPAEEHASMSLHGWRSVHVTTEDILDPLETAQMALAEREATIASVRGLLRPDGSLVENAAEVLKAILKGA